MLTERSHHHDSFNETMIVVYVFGIPSSEADVNFLKVGIENMFYLEVMTQRKASPANSLLHDGRFMQRLNSA